MTTIISADFHLDDQPRNNYRHVFVEQTLPKLINTYKYDRLICLGDLCQDKDRHSAELVNRVVNSITALSRLCEVVILRGNHDYINPESPFFGFLSKLTNVTWIGKPAQVNGELFLPHTRDHHRDWKNMKDCGVKIIFAHQTFQGANAGNQILDGIPLDMFPENVNIISGDIHVPQKIYNLRYVGAPYTINFGDKYNPRVLILRGDKITTLPVNGPKKVLLEIDDPRHIPEVKLTKGDMIKVRVKLNKFEEFPKVKKILTEWLSNHGVIIHSIQPVASTQGRLRAGLEKTPIKSDQDQVKSYVAKIGVSKEVLDVGLKLMEEGRT